MTWFLLSVSVEALDASFAVTIPFSVLATILYVLSPVTHLPGRFLCPWSGVFGASTSLYATMILIHIPVFDKMADFCLTKVGKGCVEMLDSSGSVTVSGDLH